MNIHAIIFFLCIVTPFPIWAMELGTYTQDLTSDTKLLQALCNGPKPEDHIFSEARFIQVSEDNPFNATVMGAAEDTMSMSIMEFGNDGLDPVETTSAPSLFKTHSVMQNLRCSGTLALVCVHGTYSKEMGFGDKIERKSTHAIIDLAQKLGISYNKAVEIVSFVWSGILDIKARKEAGKQLADFLVANAEKYDSIWTIAHSHGCNVVNWAGLDMLEQGHVLPIDTAIHLASPTPDFEVDKTALEGIAHPDRAFNMKKIFNYYGSNDCTQVFGSLQSAWVSGRKTRPGTQAECIAYNVRAQLNGYQLNHSTIKTVIRHLPALLHAIETFYPCFFDLDANVIEQEDGTIAYPMVAIRKQSNDPHHPLLRENYRRACAYSAHQEERYKNQYGVSIHDKASLWWRAVVSPVQEWWCRAGHDKLPPESNSNNALADALLGQRRSATP